MHVAGVFVSCMSSVTRAFVRTPNSRAALTIHAKLFTFTRVKRVHAHVCTHACVKFKVSGTVNPLNIFCAWLHAYYTPPSAQQTQSKYFGTYMPDDMIILDHCYTE